MKISKNRFAETLMRRAIRSAFGSTVSILGVASLGLAVAPAAFAQSNATGGIYGTVTNAAGKSLVLSQKGSGVQRSITLDASGKYNLTSLPVGLYTVQLLDGGKVVSTYNDVEVRLSQNVEVSFSAALQTVVVSSSAKKLDMTEMGSTTIFTATELAKIPVGNNVGAVIQLAPSTTSGDTRYGGGGAPSFGGSSASENAYYINGFPVTNMLTQVGFSQLPFGSIAQAQILTGGYGAEFGRSTGGVVNIVTKSGSNEMKGSVGYTFSPDMLRAKQRNIFYADNGTTLANKLYAYNESNQTDSMQASFSASGPIIKDKLFFYFATEQNRTDSSSIRGANSSATYTAAASTQSTAWNEITTSTPRSLLKLDWNLNQDHHLEYTKISDKVTSDRRYYGFNYATLQRTYVQNGGQKFVNWGPTPVAATQGAEVDILKYTGYLTDKLTLSAVLGQTKTDHRQIPAGYDPTLPQVSSDSTTEAPGLGPYAKPQGVTGSLLVPGARDRNQGARVDLEYKLNSAHSLRLGVDQNTIRSTAGSGYTGGFLWNYLRATNPASPVDRYAAPNSVTGNALAQQGYYVQQIFVNTKSSPSVEQTAQYIEDRWQVTDKLLVSLGLRNEGFNNKNGDNQSYVNLPSQLAPRFAASFDVMGDKSFKVFSSLGRYHVPLPTNVAVRAAGASLYTIQNFAYTGVNSLGQPTGLTPFSPVYSNNNELGQSKDPLTVAALDMKGNFQDELAMGFERALSKDLNVGGKVTYRSLKTAIDDHCDDRPFIAWAGRNGVNSSDFHYNCALFNPGIANTFMVDYGDGNGLRKVALTADELGIPKVKRTYAALDLFAEHPFDGKWYGKVNYTLSRNAGNTEGQLLSDIGQGDVSTTQAFDFPEFSRNANGRLPNDRRHQLKAFGYYQATQQVGFGTNILVASGRPKNCIGNAPVATASATPYTPGSPVTNYSGYGSAYFFCNGVDSPRGSLGSLPNTVRLDLNVTYLPTDYKGVSLKLDVFNVFNRQSTETIEERYNSGTGLRALYSTPLAYSAPRSMRISALYEF